MRLQCGIQGIEDFDLRVPAPLLEQVARELGIGLVVRRAYVVRLGSEVLEPGVEVRRTQRGIEALFQGLLSRRVRGIETEQHRRTISPCCEASCAGESRKDEYGRPSNTRDHS